MTWQCRNVLVSTHFWLFIILLTVTLHITFFTVITGYRIYSLLQKMLVAFAKLKKCARFYFGNDVFASKSNEVESRYLPEKVTSLQVESSVQKSTL